MLNALRAAVLLLGFAGFAPHAAQSAGPPNAVGVRLVEYVTPDHRAMSMVVFYPAGSTGPQLELPFTVGLDLRADAPVLADGARHPLVMLSHGRGSDAFQYAWLGQALAANGMVVAGVNHYRANTYQREIGWLANRIWQRPIDISLGITYLLSEPAWRDYLDPEAIGVMGHSQGGFTALWIGGARVNAERFLAFQRRFINDPKIPEAIRRDLPLDAGPALAVADPRVKAIFAMAPGVVQAFGMDAEGLRQLAVPAFLAVGEADGQTPPADNAVFAAEHIPGARLWVIPGPVGHEIFTNECDEEGRNEFPEACVDHPGVDRHALHEQIAAAALDFFRTNLRPR
ncbi:MAG: hypothetical protein JOZ05_16210 [Acetobacteraceae bacterium]|nr:hypothetical protein [Acetobacteraceae bacterium]